MAVSTNTLRSGLLTLLVVASVVALASLAGGMTQANGETDGTYAVQQDGIAFENGTVVEQRGDVARYTVLFDGADRATVTIGSPDVNYEVSFAVVDRDGDGEATVGVNTAVAGQEAGTNATGIEAVGDDEVVDYEMATEPVPGPLEAVTYDLELTADGERVDVGALVLNERATEGMTIWTAPNATQPDDTAELLDVATRADRVAQGDWAVLAIEVSGVFGYVEGIEDLDDPANGMNVTFVEDPGRNVPERGAEVPQLGLAADETNDTLFVLVETDDLNVTSEYTATFTVNDSNPYLEPGENESASATFAVGERNLSFDTNATGQLELPAASDATVGGTTTAAPGTVVDVELSTSGAGAFLRTGEATVTDDGTWSVTFDLSEASDGTEFQVQTDDPAANASGVILEDAETETATEEAGTPTEGTETPTDATGTPEETETGEEETETPGEAGTTEEVVETTTVDDEETEASNALTAGGLGSSFGLVGLVVAATFAVLRRH